jgi:hypothetical protein
MLFFQCHNCNGLLQSYESLSGEEALCPRCGGANLVPPYSFSFIATLFGQTHDTLCACLHVGARNLGERLGVCYTFEAGCYLAFHLQLAGLEAVVPDWLMVNLVRLCRYRITLEPYDFLRATVDARLAAYQHEARRYYAAEDSRAQPFALNQMLRGYLRSCPDDYAELAEGQPTPTLIEDPHAAEFHHRMDEYADAFHRPAFGLIHALFKTQRQLPYLGPFDIRRIAAEIGGQAQPRPVYPAGAPSRLRLTG